MSNLSFKPLTPPQTSSFSNGGTPMSNSQSTLAASALRQATLNKIVGGKKRGGGNVPVYQFTGSQNAGVNKIVVNANAIHNQAGAYSKYDNLGITQKGGKRTTRKITTRKRTTRKRTTRKRTTRKRTTKRR
jgi:hypothetical protein